MDYEDLVEHKHVVCEGEDRRGVNSDIKKVSGWNALFEESTSKQHNDMYNSYNQLVRPVGFYL